MTDPTAPASLSPPRQQPPKAIARQQQRRRGAPFDQLPAGVPVPLDDTASSVACALALGAIPAGFPSPADDYVESRIDLNLELIPRPLSTFFMRVCGDAMAGDGILNGDLLVIDRSVQARAGLVVVATHRGSFIVRRLQRAAGRSGVCPGERQASWQLVASDGLTPPLSLAADDTELWGVVIHAVHHLAAAPSRRR